MNVWELDLFDCYDYGKFSELTLPVSLASDSWLTAAVEAKVDTGSTFCVFQPLYARLLSRCGKVRGTFGGTRCHLVPLRRRVLSTTYLDLELERGAPQRIGTATGSFLAYGHEVTMTIGDLTWQAVVYFAESENFPINVVGRVGFLDRLRIGLVDYEQLLYLAAYDAA